MGVVCFHPFAWLFFGLHGGGFWVFLEKHNQGTLGVKTSLYKYSIVKRVQVCFISKIDFSNSKHDPSKMTLMN
jgi:hypothetical protein